VASGNSECTKNILSEPRSLAEAYVNSSWSNEKVVALALYRRHKSVVRAILNCGLKIRWTRVLDWVVENKESRVLRRLANMEQRLRSKKYYWQSQSLPDPEKVGFDAMALRLRVKHQLAISTQDHTVYQILQMLLDKTTARTKHRSDRSPLNCPLFVAAKHGRMNRLEGLLSRRADATYGQGHWSSHKGRRSDFPIHNITLDIAVQWNNVGVVN